VHINAPVIVLGVILSQPGDENIYHPVYFSSINLSQVEHNYTTTKREGLEMVYALQKFRHYFLGKHFKFFTDHFALKSS
jgi:hypothetical protein